MANTLAELVRYCREENTFGALLLCGEWGSGKTHLLENELPGQLGEKYLLIRISLFGEDSVDSVRRKVQTALDLHFPGAGLRPEPYPEGRKLILAFDDLERTNLSQVEILGCINEYCENLHIKTIVVANEEKIEGRSVQRSGTEDNRKREYLVYSEMKEKLIDRTVRLKMNDAGIVGSIIRQYRTSLEGYVDFLQESRDEIISLLDDCELKNIRSLRCGMQDFERIYEFCSREGLPADQIRKYFTSFVLFTMLAKGGKITKSSTYGYGLNRLQEKYRGHYWNRYMPDCMKDGVMTGDWREEKIREQIRRTKEYMDGTMKPENRICSMTLLEMDDDTVAAGWKPFLGLAYAGRLSPEEYILLIRNLSEARAYGYRWPVKPDLKRLDQGTELAFQRICDSGEAPEPLRERMDEEAREKCTEAELRIAEKIYEFTDGRGYRNRTDRERLLAALRSRDEKALFGCRRCELAQIDEELVQEIAECYGALRSNQSRVAYADLILRILSTAGAEEYGKESRECLKKLGKMLKTRLTEQKDRPLECMAIRYFLEGTERL